MKKSSSICSELSVDIVSISFTCGYCCFKANFTVKFYQVLLPIICFLSGSFFWFYQVLLPIICFYQFFLLILSNQKRSLKICIYICRYGRKVQLIQRHQLGEVQHMHFKENWTLLILISPRTPVITTL